MDNLFKEKSKTIKIYLGIETIIDPYEKNVETTILNPLPIKAIITDLTATKAQYAMAGIVVDKAKEIIINKRYESLLLKSQKIQIGSEYFVGWRQNSKLQYRIEGDYLRAYIYIRKS